MHINNSSTIVKDKDYQGIFYFILLLPFIYLFFNAEDCIQDLAHAKHTLYHENIKVK
jgi:hypothetical protein